MKRPEPTLHDHVHETGSTDVLRTQVASGCMMSLHNLLLVDVVGPPSAEICRTVANFPQVDDLRFINP